jgi:FAD/FMN-containing dehydrogenase
MAKENTAYREIFADMTKILGDSRVKQGLAPIQIIVRPKTTDEVSRILKLAEREEVPIFPVREMPWVKVDSNEPVAIMMDTSDMNGIFEIDEQNLTVTVGPGVFWKNLYQMLSKRKYSIGAYPNSSSPLVGDWIDCGGAGIGSYGNGFAGDQVRTMEIVLPNGKVIDTGFKKVLANSSGYNLNGLFVGADSTLGIITKITLKMYPKPEGTLPLFYQFTDPTIMKEALLELTKQKTTPLNISFFDRNHVQTLKMYGRDIPEIQGILVNITLAGLKAVLKHDEGVIDNIMEKHGATKVTGSVANALWTERFFDVQAKGAGLTPVFAEVLVPLTYLSDLIQDTYDLITKMNAKAAVAGILSDRSTVAFTPYILEDKKATDTSRTPALFAEKLGEFSLRYHGRPVGSTLFLVSGIKSVYGEGINTIMDIKSAIDPHDIMNPQLLK